MRIFESMRGFQLTAIVKTAIELGVFSALAEGGSTASDLAVTCRASERGMRILCDSLVVEQLMEKTGGRYRNTPETALFLKRESPAYLGGAAEFLCDPQMSTSLMNDLTSAVRKGGTMIEGEGTVNPDNPLWVKFARAMAPMMMPAAQAIAGMVAGSGPLKVLDIAAGHGLFGISIAQRNAQAEITALDWAAVLEVAKENAAKAGVAARYKTLPGSAFDVDYGSDYDVVLLTNFLHHFDTETNEKLLRKVHAALKPGGRAVTLEFSPEDDRVSPPVPARFALTMLFTTARGDAYTFHELEAMAHRAGFQSSAHHRLETEQSVIISTK
ncbi:MAG: class I SAM-dependent methyltransferase [Terriglobia bacterium]